MLSNKKYLLFLLLLSNNTFHYIHTTTPHIGGVPLRMPNYIRDAFFPQNLPEKRTVLSTIYYFFHKKWRNLQLSRYLATLTNTPLISAVIDKNLYVAHALLANGALPDYSIDGVLNPALCAVLNNDYAMLRLLLCAGVDINKPNNEGITPLLYAVTGNVQERTIKFLVQYGASINKVTTINKIEMSPLNRTQERKNIAHFFLENGAKINSDRDYYWAYPLMTQLENEYHPQYPYDIANLAKVLNQQAPASLITPLARIVAEYGVPSWKERIELRKQKNSVRGKMLALRGIENYKLPDTR